jgi:hypothetical protein
MLELLEEVMEEEKTERPSSIGRLLCRREETCPEIEDALR